MSHPFDVALALAPVSSEDRARRFSGFVTEDWMQGRGAFGGLTAALLHRAMERVVDDARRVPRTLHVHFVAPVRAASFVVVVERVRDGGLVSHLSATMLQDDAKVAFAVSTFAAGRDDGMRYDEHTAPRALALDDTEVVELGPPIAPVFTRHFEYRFALGEPPYSSASSARIGGYFRARPPRRLDVALALAALDAWPPAVLSRVDGMRAAASVDMRVELLPALFATPVDDAAHLLVECRSRHAEDGYADEEASLSVGGRVVARCQQLIALLGATR